VVSEIDMQVPCLVEFTPSNRIQKLLNVAGWLSMFPDWFVLVAADVQHGERRHLLLQARNSRPSQFDPVSIGLPADFKLTDYSKLKG
jgi:hypothetical protein